MSVKCREIVEFMENLAPVKLAESYDNVGLLAGSPGKDIDRILLCLDITREVVAEAVSEGADMIISHHPVIFAPMKRIREDDPKGYVLYELIRNGICAYSAHTNLDVAGRGVNAVLAEKIGLKSLRPLKKHYVEPLYKIVVYVPEGSLDPVRTAMCNAGAGWVGNYSDCTFTVNGTGTFRPLEGTRPYIGTHGKFEQVKESRLETIVTADRLERVISEMIKNHPYEEPAYDVYKTETPGKTYPLGLAGELSEPVSFDTFIGKVKEALSVPVLRIIGKPAGNISSAAVFCGSFDDDLKAVCKSGAEVLVTGDMKYHTATDAEALGLCIIDAGHYNTEKVILPELRDLLKANFNELEIYCNGVEKDPFIFY